VGLTLTQKIVTEHLVGGRVEPGEEIVLRVDQTLLREAPLGVPCLQIERMDCLPPDNGIPTRTHLERLAVPGQTLLGADGPTPACGALAMLAIIARDADIAAARAGQPFRLTMPRTVHVRLAGRLRPGVAAPDLVLGLPNQHPVPDSFGYVLEYGGPGAATLTVPERAAICSLAAEMGATTSIFPSDAQARAYLRDRGREDVWQPLAADLDAAYDETIPLDLGQLEPARSKTS